MIKLMTRPGRLFRLQIVSLLLLIIFSSLALYINYRSQDVSERLLVEQVQARQLVLARAGGSSIEWFFKTIKSEIGAMNKISAIQAHDLTQTRSIFKLFVQRYYTQPFLEIALMDENAKVLIDENKLGVNTAEGKLFTDRAYYKWAKDPAHRDQIWTSDPFVSRAGMTKGKMVVAITTPLYYRNQFKGLVLILSELDGFTAQFIAPLRTYVSNKAYLIDSNNVVLSADSNLPLEGKKLIDIISENGVTNVSEFNSKLAQSNLTDEGITQWTSVFANGQKVPNLIAYKKLSVGDQTWMLVISTPRITVTSLLAPYLPFQMITILLIVSCTFLAGIIFIVASNTSKLQGFKKGLRQGYSS